MRIINCCTIDCAQDHLDRHDRDGYSSAELLKIYGEDLPTDGITPLISPSSCDYSLDNEYAHAGSYASIHKRKQNSYENLDANNSLTGPVATTYDESEEVDMAKSRDSIKEGRMSHLPKYVVKRAVGDANESGEIMRSILTGREGRVKGLFTNVDESFDASNVLHEYQPRGRTGLQARKDWWKGA